MMTGMNRRNLFKGALAAGAAASLPARVFAAPEAASARDLALADIAKRELEKAGEAIWRHDIVGIADFGLRSSEERFHFVNLEQGSVRSFYVAHGAGSDPEHDGWLNNFSNVEGSNATSQGAYVTWEWYKGRYGTSIRLGGLDRTNSNALPRAIVMHPAEYARRSHVEKWGRLGRSNGCFAMDPEDFREALWNLSGGRLLFADWLSLGKDGQKVASAPLNIHPLIAEGTRGIEQMVPGAY
jgi:hypothetical protein